MSTGLTHTEHDTRQSIFINFITITLGFLSPWALTCLLHPLSNMIIMALAVAVHSCFIINNATKLNVGQKLLICPYTLAITGQHDKMVTHEEWCSETWHWWLPTRYVCIRVCGPRIKSHSGQLCAYHQSHCDIQLWNGIHTLTAVPKSTQPSNLHKT